ncbi:hypothetical protein JAAARDRAFT_199097 [Jaapia argillacea MUCL 33604]|uniref:Uncharacterized protein n=1 Tax=Jaapia argillacea MUCL 33604 TaxID=933084 RepID=A0A067PKE5_9AGAM|nr:hypothetical protein JAAARDRAFT_199097 [Jaapia argillacea MUCL 33604]
MVMLTRHLSSIDTNTEAGMFALKELQQWSTEHWIEADQEIAAFTDEVAGAIAQITKSNKALQAKLDATERVLSGQNNVSSVFSYATGSGSGYAVLPSPVPSVESLLMGPNTRVPSKEGSVSPQSFLMDRTAGRVMGTNMVPETPFPAHDTSDANILASISHLGEGRHLPNESVLDYNRRRAAAQWMAQAQSTPFIERACMVSEPVPRTCYGNGGLPEATKGLPPSRAPPNSGTSRVPPLVPPRLPSLPTSGRFDRDGPPHIAGAKEPTVLRNDGGGIGGAPPAPPPLPGSSHSSATSSNRRSNSDERNDRGLPHNHHGPLEGDANRGNRQPDGDRTVPGGIGGGGSSPPGGGRGPLDRGGSPPDRGGGPPGGDRPPSHDQGDDSSDDNNHTRDELSYGPSNVRFDLGADPLSSASCRLRPERMSHTYSGSPRAYLNPTAIVNHPDKYEEESLTRIRVLIQECLNHGQSSQPLPKGVKTPTPYHWEGEDDIEKFENWFQFLLRWMSMQGLTGVKYDRTRVDFLGQFLRKQALSWFNHKIDTSRYYERGLNFEKVVCALHTWFLHKATAQEAVHKFLNCKFSSETGVAAFYNALHHNAARMVVAPDDYTFRREFLAGIPEEIRGLLMKNWGVNAEFTPSEVMYREAIEMETSLRFIARQRQLSGARLSKGKSLSSRRTKGRNACSPHRNDHRDRSPDNRRNKWDRSS